MSKLCKLCLLLHFLLWRLAGTLVPTNHLHEEGWRVSLWPLKNEWSQTVICSWTKGPLLTFQPSFNAIKLSKRITLMHPTDLLSSIYSNHPYPTSKAIIFVKNIELTTIFYGFEGVFFLVHIQCWKMRGWGLKQTPQPGNRGQQRVWLHSRKAPIQRVNKYCVLYSLHQNTFFYQQFFMWQEETVSRSKHLTRDRNRNNASQMIHPCFSMMASSRATPTSPDLRPARTSQ